MTVDPTAIPTAESFGTPEVRPQGFNNVSFEAAGSEPGFASDWTLTATQSAFSVAAFDPVPQRGVEDYERGWGNEPYREDFGSGETDAAAFSTPVGAGPVETYEMGWSNEPYYDDLNSRTAADFGQPEGETYEDGWGNAPIQDDVDVVATITEDYESGWPTDGGPIDDLGVGDVTAAEFTVTGGLLEYEDYDAVKFDQDIILADPSTDFLSVPAHGFVAGAQVTIVNLNGFPPGGLFSDTVYYVKSPTANAFQLALSPGGGTINLTDSGSGTNRVRADPTVFWVGDELTF